VSVQETETWKATSVPINFLKHGFNVPLRRLVMSPQTDYCTGKQPLYSENRAKSIINTQYGQNLESLNVKAGGTATAVP
jgi:hypothetical protein